MAVNLFNRSAWYHRAIQDFIARGEIGDLAIIRVSQVAQEMLDFAAEHSPPSVGTPEQMRRILDHREQLRRAADDLHPSIQI